MNLRNLTNFDFFLFFSVLVLSIIGISFIYSSGINSDGMLVSNEYVKQIIWLSSGIILLIFAMFFDLRRFADRTFLLFCIVMLVLIYTSFFGRYVNGARSWLGIKNIGIQPSEFSKIFYILYFAYFLDKSKNTDSDFSRFLKSLLILFIPVVLILMQPDLGTASVFLPIYLAMAFLGGIKPRYLGILFLTASSAIIFTVLPFWELHIKQESITILQVLTDQKIRLILVFALSLICLISLIGKVIFKKQYFYWFAYGTGILIMSLIGSYLAQKVLKDYQIMRLVVFLDPNVDPLGSGWNIIQSKTAIGSGGLNGLGFLKGTQSHYRFLPQQSTDFIFSILCEEWGFIGGLTVFILYSFIFIRSLIIIKKNENFYESLIVIGILSMFFFHFIVNIGMVMGIMPITGIPLLFLSYGGSSLWTAFIAIGFLLGINNRRIMR